MFCRSCWRIVACIRSIGVGSTCGEAAGKGLVKLPIYEPVQERIKLIGQKQSEHFLFRYGPGPTQKNISRPPSRTGRRHTPG
jgi:hypothetical protein